VHFGHARHRKCDARTGARLFEIVQGVSRCEDTKVAVSAAVAVAAACVCRQGNN